MSATNHQSVIIHDHYPWTRSESTLPPATGRLARPSSRTRRTKLWHDKPGSLNSFLYRLAKRQAPGAGKYMILPDAGVSGEYTEHDYRLPPRLALHDRPLTALNHHHLTEQIPDRSVKSQDQAQ